LCGPSCFVTALVLAGPQWEARQTRQPRLGPSVQSLTGKLQGRITTQGNPCNYYRNEFTEYNFLLFWLHFFPCFKNIEIVALVPVMCT